MISKVYSTKIVFYILTTEAGNIIQKKNKVTKSSDRRKSGTNFLKKNAILQAIHCSAAIMTRLDLR